MELKFGERLVIMPKAMRVPATTNNVMGTNKTAAA
jgi:hypothetical protein